MLATTFNGTKIDINKHIINLFIFPLYNNYATIIKIFFYSVDNNGKIKGIKVGKAIINATIGSLSTSCVIEVANIAFAWDNGSEYLISNGAGAPRVYALTNGKLIAGFETSGSNNTLEIKTVISKDGGKTWLNKTTASFQPDKNCANINFYIYQNKLYMAYSVMKTIYSNITAKELINKIKTGKSITKDFSPPDNIFQTPNGKSTIWTGIHYKNGWLYASISGKSSHQSGALLKKIYIG